MNKGILQCKHDGRKDNRHEKENHSEKACDDSHVVVKGTNTEIQNQKRPDIGKDMQAETTE